MKIITQSDSVRVGSIRLKAQIRTKEEIITKPRLNK